MAKDVVLNMKVIAKALGTNVKKSKSADMGEFIKFNLETIKGEMHYDGSGGMYFKPKHLGLDCYISHGKVLEQIEEVEQRINAYSSMLSDLKRIRKAIKSGTPKLPEKRDAVGNTKTSAVVSRSSRRAEKEAATKKGRR